jgi:hypothetical protein
MLEALSNSEAKAGFVQQLTCSFSFLDWKMKYYSGCDAKPVNRITTATQFRRRGGGGFV